MSTATAERYLTDPGMRQAVVNWPEVARAALARLHRQLLQAPLDDRLRALVGCAEDAVGDLPLSDAGEVDGLVVCPGFRAGDEVIRTITQTAWFDTAIAIMLDDLCIELIYPQDATAERFFRAACRNEPFS